LDECRKPITVLEDNSFRLQYSENIIASAHEAIGGKTGQDPNPVESPVFLVLGRKALIPDAKICLCGGPVQNSAGTLTSQGGVTPHVEFTTNAL
jgi:hypothetical protein